MQMEWNAMQINQADYLPASLYHRQLNNVEVGTGAD